MEKSITEHRRMDVIIKVFNQRRPILKQINITEISKNTTENGIYMTFHCIKNLKKCIV